MTWNYRIMRHDNWPEGGAPVYAIHQVYCDKEGSVSGYATEPVSPFADSPQELQWTLQRMLEGLSKDTLVYIPEEEIGVK